MDATKGGRSDTSANVPSGARPSDSQHMLRQLQTRIDKHWIVIGRLVLVQLGCGLLMQLSYVAFPAYNFALALWCLVCCTPKWMVKNPRLVPLHLFAIAFSILTDVVWMSLWVSGRVFFDQFCGQNGVTIVSCGGPTDHFPGCQTNRFALFTLIVNDLAKAAVLVAVYRVRSLAGPGMSSGGDHHHHHHHHHHSAHTHTDVSASSPVGTINPSAVRQMPTGMLPT